MKFSHDRLAKEARREIRQRGRVYPGLVAQHRLSPADMAERIAMMEAIAEHFERLAKDEAGQAELFDGRASSDR